MDERRMNEYNALASHYIALHLNEQKEREWEREDNVYFIFAMSLKCTIQVSVFEMLPSVYGACSMRPDNNDWFNFVVIVDNDNIKSPLTTDSLIFKDQYQIPR